MSALNTELAQGGRSVEAGWFAERIARAHVREQRSREHTTRLGYD
jgi:hypothetical protein